MSDESLRVELVQKVSDAPEVKGSASYLIPHRVTWQVTAYRYSSGTWGQYERAVLEGPGRSGRWRGAALFDMADVPDWLPVPHGWLARARSLVAAQVGDPR